METTTADDYESRTDTPEFLWQRALSQADDDLRKTLLATKTNRRGSQGRPQSGPGETMPISLETLDLRNGREGRHHRP